MSRFIALAGTHRTGKTTSADYLAKYYGGVAVQTELGTVTKECQLPRTGATNLTDLCMVQGHMLQHLTNKIISTKSMHSSSIFCDRSPIDLAAYLLAQAEFMNKKLSDDYVNEYISEVVALSQHITNIVYLPPSISPAANSTSFDLDDKRLLVDSHLKSLLLHPDVASKVIYVPEDITNVFARLAFITEALGVPPDTLDSYTTAEMLHSKLYGGVVRASTAHNPHTINADKFSVDIVEKVSVK